MRQVLDRLMRFGAQRPRLTLALFAILTVACAAVSLTLEPSSNIDTLVSSSSTDYRATQQDDRQFGGDAVEVLVRAPLTQLLGSHDLGVLSKLEACLGGQQVSASRQLAAYEPVPAAKAQPYGGATSPCGHLMADKPAQVVYGPATFLNQAVVAVNTQLDALLASVTASVKASETAASAAAARRGESAAKQKAAATAAGQRTTASEEAKLVDLMQSTGLSEADLPSLDNASFIQTVVFDASGPSHTPKARFSYLFPTAQSALISVRLKPNLSTHETAQAIRWVRQATQMQRFALGSRASYLVSGEPVVLNDVSAILSGQVLVLLVGSVLVMGVVLVLVFRQRRRLLPLVLALGAVAITFALCAAGGGSLTLASIAVLPILIGLAVDYGIQFQSRASGPSTIAAAALATATGFLVLLLSPVPMVRGFGLLLVIGVAVAFFVVLVVGTAVLALPDLGLLMPQSLRASLRGAGELLAAPVGSAGRLARRPGRAVGGVTDRISRELMAALRGAGEILSLGRLRTGGGGSRRSGKVGVGTADPASLLARLSRRPMLVLGVGLILAAVGWAVDPHTAVQSDVTKLVPKSLPALQGLNTLERTTGESGELDVLVHGRDVATPATITWMVNYEQAIVTHFGYVDTTGCQAQGAIVCPALSLPDLFASSTSSSAAGSGSGSAAGSGSGANSSTTALTQAQINTLLAAVPAYFSQAVITRNRGYAALTFGIKLMPLAQQARVIDYMRDHLNPPAGVSAQLAGLPVLTADAYVALSSSSRRLLTLLAGLVAVALMLLAIFRSPRRALIPLVPIVLATGWSALIVWVIGIPLNPMSATLGALVIAISTEFSVLLSERFRRQRAAGEAPALALANAYRSTGKAVLASGVTAIAGFAVLIVSNVTMLRDFGLVTLIDMSVSLLGVLALLPAVLTLGESGALGQVALRRLPGPPRLPWPLRPRGRIRPHPQVPA